MAKYMYDEHGNEYEVGYQPTQDIVGEDDQDIVGQVFRPSLPGRGQGGSQTSRVQQAMSRLRPTGRTAQPAQPAQPIGAREAGLEVVDQTAGPCKGTLRRQVLPASRTDVAAGGQATMKLEPQRVFRVERLVLVSSIGPLSNCFLTSLNVGADPQFVATGEVPVRAYAPDAIDTSLRGMTAKPGVQVIITLLNVGGAPETISGMLTGWAID